MEVGIQEVSFMIPEWRIGGPSARDFTRHTYFIKVENGHMTPGRSYLILEKQSLSILMILSFRGKKCKLQPIMANAAFLFNGIDSRSYFHRGVMKGIIDSIQRQSLWST